MVLEKCGLIILQGKMQGTLRVSDWKLGYWRESLRKGQDGECEKAVGVLE